MRLPDTEAKCPYLPCSSLIAIRSALLDTRSGHVNNMLGQALVTKAPSDLKFSQTLVLILHWHITVLQVCRLPCPQGHGISPGVSYINPVTLSVQEGTVDKGTRLIEVRMPDRPRPPSYLSQSGGTAPGLGQSREGRKTLEIYSTISR